MVSLLCVLIVSFDFKTDNWDLRDIPYGHWLYINYQLDALIIIYS